MATHRYVVCDVFTDRPLAGNQLAVFTDAREMPDELYQRLAREMNFSETVFVLPPEGEGHVRLRIFTPSTELPFAGHPILGSAFVLAGPLQFDEIRLETGSSVVLVRLEREGPRIVFGRMEQPLPSVEPFEDEAEVLAALGVERSELPIELYDNGARHVYVCLGSEEEVAALRPDMSRLADLPAVLGVNSSPGGAPAGRLACSRRAEACPRTRRPARRRARWPSTSPGTGASASARRSRSRRGPRSVGPRSSTQRSTAPTTSSSGSKSADPRSSSPAANSGS